MQALARNARPPTQLPQAAGTPSDRVRRNNAQRLFACSTAGIGLATASGLASYRYLLPMAPKALPCALALTLARRACVAAMPAGTAGAPASRGQAIYQATLWGASFVLLGAETVAWSPGLVARPPMPALAAAGMGLGLTLAPIGIIAALPQWAQPSIGRMARLADPASAPSRFLARTQPALDVLNVLALLGVVGSPPVWAVLALSQGFGAVWRGIGLVEHGPHGSLARSMQQQDRLSLAAVSAAQLGACDWRRWTSRVGLSG